MASVVALSLNGTAIGTLANPDGSYRIDGIPPGDYFVYTQPLPPRAAGRDHAGGHRAAFRHARWRLLRLHRIRRTIFSAHAGLAAGGHHDGEGGSKCRGHQLRRGSARRPHHLRHEPAGLSGPARTESVCSCAVAGFRLSRLDGVRAPGTLLPNTTLLRPGMSLSVIGPAARLEPEYLGYFMPDTSTPSWMPNKVSQPTPVAVAVTTPTICTSCPRPLRWCPRPGR